MSSRSTHQELEKFEDAFSKGRSGRIVSTGKQLLNSDEFGKHEVKVVDVGRKAGHTRCSSRERETGCRLSTWTRRHSVSEKGEWRTKGRETGFLYGKRAVLETSRPSDDMWRIRQTGFDHRASWPLSPMLLRLISVWRPRGRLRTVWI